MYNEPAHMQNQHDEEAWQHWLADNATRLLLFARQQTRTEPDAEDVFQESCIRVWQQWRRLRGTPTDARRFAFATIRRVAVDLARRQDRRLAREQRAAVEADPPIVWFAGNWETEERARAIQTALARVPAEQREVIVLKTWGELTFAEIAEVLDIPANTAASRYRLGIEALRLHLPTPP
jgi:RNA polymerase sigma-70 factor (ECF subfamily)